LPIFVRAVYSDPRHVRAMMVIRIIKRQLVTWSVISFCTMTRKGWAARLFFHGPAFPLDAEKK
jgi:hypothetical protein